MMEKTPDSADDVTSEWVVPRIPTLTPTGGATLIPTEPPTEAPTPTPTSTPTPTPASVLDVEVPVVTLLGENRVELIAKNEYIEPGYKAEDVFDGDITDRVTITGTVDVNLGGTYVLTYEVTDNAGNQTRLTREVIVKQPDVIVPEEKVIYLTFDDGPGKYTNEVLEILAKYNIKATFFTCGNSQPKMVTKTYEAGHVVGIHCTSHDYNLIYASEEAYFEDLYKMQDLVYECTGIKSTLVRFPGGSSNMSSSFNPGIMTRLTTLVEQEGFQYFDWNVSSGDCGTKDTEQILENMKKGVQSRKRSVVLQHPETREYSMEALEPFIVWALENGYSFLTLDENIPKEHHKIAN